MEETENPLGEAIGDALDGVDFSGLENVFESIGDAFNFFGDGGFADKVSKILSGEISASFPNILEGLLNLAFGFVLSFLPLILLILGVAILSNFIGSISSERQTGTHKIINFACLAVVITAVITALASLVSGASASVGLIKTICEFAFPILLSFMAMIGATTSVAVYQPAMAIFSNSILLLFEHILMPIFAISLVFAIVSNLTDKTRLTKFSAFFASLFKWIVGITFTVFLAFVAIQGITAGHFDGISVRATKLAMSSYVPILGGYLSQGFDLIVGAGVLIKNSVGFALLLLIIITLITPILKLIIFSLSLKLIASITEPFADNKISNFISAVERSVQMLIVVLIATCVMLLILIGLVMTTGNII